MRKRRSDITKICRYCEHASFKRREGDAPSYRDVIFPNENSEIACQYRGTVAPESTCLRFTFDPVKYTPKKTPPLPTLSEEDVIS